MPSRTLRRAVLLAALAGCSTSNRSTNADAGALDASNTDAQDGGGSDAGDEGPGPAALGQPCLPFQELSSTFAGFDDYEVVVDQNETACTSGLCLVNHFRGRVSCPYGQSASGTGVGDAGGCTVPGTGMRVAPGDLTNGQVVLPNCTDRLPAADVTCSCRCADPQGQTGDGGPYCTCPGGTTCSQVVPELVAGDPLAGAYCVPDMPDGSAYDPASSCAMACDPASGDCPVDDGGTLPLPAAGGQAATYFLVTLRLQNGLCLPRTLTTDSSGKAQCQILLVIEPQDGGPVDAGGAGDAGDACASLPGLSAADPDVASAVLAAQQAPASSVVCALAQLAPSPCKTSTQPGWCYLTGAGAPSGCQEAIEVSLAAKVPLGVNAMLACP